MGTGSVVAEAEADIVPMAVGMGGDVASTQASATVPASSKPFNGFLAGTPPHGGV